MEGPSIRPIVLSMITDSYFRSRRRLTILEPGETTFASHLTLLSCRLDPRGRPGERFLPKHILETIFHERHVLDIRLLGLSATITGIFLCVKRLELLFLLSQSHTDIFKLKFAIYIFHEKRQVKYVYLILVKLQSYVPLTKDFLSPPPPEWNSGASSFCPFCWSVCDSVTLRL